MTQHVLYPANVTSLYQTTAAKKTVPIYQQLMLQWQIFLNKINFDKVVFGDKDRKLFIRRFLSPKADKLILNPIVEVKLAKTSYA